MHSWLCFGKRDFINDNNGTKKNLLMDQSILTDFCSGHFIFKCAITYLSVYVMNPYNLVTSMFSHSCQDLELQVLF